MFNYSLTNNWDDVISDSTFTVFKFKNLYFFTNYLAAQCGGANTLITDQNGKILKEIKSFTYTFNSDSTFTVHDYGNCFEYDDDKDVIYKVEENTIKEISSQ